MDLFGNNVLPAPEKQQGKRKAENLHKQLISLHGKTEGKTCRNCEHRVYMRAGNKRFSKCIIANPNLVGHVATDWRVAWQACGKFQQRETETVTSKPE